MTHTIIYNGRYIPNYERLRNYRGDPRNFRRIHDGEEKDLDPVSKNVDGIVFGYMEKVKEGLLEKDRYFAVRVENIVLGNPIKLEPTTHMDGKKYGPHPSHFKDESAMRLLKDIIKKNRKQNEHLMKIYRKYFD